MNVPWFYDRTGVGVFNLDALLENGEVTPSVSARLGIPVVVLQAFVDGDVQHGILPLFGRDAPLAQAQEVRDTIGRQGALGFLLACCLRPPV